MAQARELFNIGDAPKAASIQESATLKPVQTTIGQESLVENRMDNLLKKDSAWMQDAGLQGEQQAAARGLQNSSIAVGQVEQARIRAALPIAQQDASQLFQRDMQDGQYNQQGALNEQNYANTAALTNQSYNNTASLQKYDNLFNANMQKYNNQHQIDMTGIQHGNNVELAGINHNNATQLAGINNAHDLTRLEAGASYDQRLQAQNQISEIRAQQSNQIAAIEQNMEMSAEQKANAINNLISLNNATVNAIELSAGLAQSSFTFSGVTSGTVTGGGTNPTPEETKWAVVLPA